MISRLNTLSHAILLLLKLHDQRGQLIKRICLQIKDLIFTFLPVIGLNKINEIILLVSLLVDLPDQIPLLSHLTHLLSCQLHLLVQELLRLRVLVPEVVYDYMVAYFVVLVWHEVFVVREVKPSFNNLILVLVFDFIVFMMVVHVVRVMVSIRGILWVGRVVVIAYVVMTPQIL